MNNVILDFLQRRNTGAHDTIVKHIDEIQLCNASTNTIAKIDSFNNVSINFRDNNTQYDNDNLAIITLLIAEHKLLDIYYCNRWYTLGKIS